MSVSDSDAVIAANLLKVVRRKLDMAFRQSAVSIRRRLQGVCEGLIAGTLEYRSLLSGELLGELGVPDVANRLREVLETIKGGVEVISQPVTVAGDQIRGGILVGMVRSGFEDVLGLSAATYASGEHNIPWLRWLLTAGDRIMVYGYDVTFNINEVQRRVSRTGLALMIPKPGHGWRVPAWASGRLDNNFVTRAFNGPTVGDTIAGIMQEEIQSRLDR